MKEEPSYMMFARAAIRNRESLPYSAVERLVNRIDQLEKEKANEAARLQEAAEQDEAEWNAANHPEGIIIEQRMNKE